MSWETETEYSSPGFHKRLFTLMGTQGHTTHTLADAAGITERQVWNILHGRSVPRVDTLIRLCRVLNTTLDYLYPVHKEVGRAGGVTLRTFSHVPARIPTDRADL